MKRIVALFLFLAVLAVAQEPTAIFKSKTELVLLPVVVTRDGQSVPGLKASDFIIRHEGKQEDIAVFEDITATSPPARALNLPPNSAVNFGNGNIQSDTTIVLLDFLNGRWENTARMRTYIHDFAKLFAESHTRTAVLLLTPKGLVQAHSFSADPADLLEAVDEWQSKQTVDPNRDPFQINPETSWTSIYSVTSKTGEADVLEKLALPPSFSDQRKLDLAAMTTQALEQIGAAFGGLPGRKRLIWVSTGFPMVGDIDADPSRVLTQFKLHDKIARAWQTLSTSNIVVYPIDSNGGPVTPGFGTPPNTASMLEVAARTGGRTCVDLLNNCMERTVTSDRQYYLLGFYLKGKQKPGWHKLKVELKGGHADIRTRSGFVVGDDTPPDDNIDRDIVLTALASPLDYTGVPLTLNWKEIQIAGKHEIEVQVSSPPGGVIADGSTGKLSVDLLAFLRPVGKPDGNSYPVSLSSTLSPERQKSLIQNGFLFRKQIPVASGSYQLKVFLRDNISAKIGTVSTTVNVR